MVAIEKFMFDLSFDDDLPAVNATPQEEDGADIGPGADQTAPPEPPPPVPTFTEEEVTAQVEAARADARADGHTQGLEQGRQEILSSVEKTAADAGTVIGEKLIALYEQQAAVHHQLSEDAVSLAIGITKKIIPRYAARYPLSEVEYVLSRCLARLFEAPKVLVHVHDDLVEILEKNLTDIAKAKGFDGAIMVLGDAGLSVGDCRVEWGDGSAERKSDAIWAEIDTIVEEAFAAHVMNDEAPVGKAPGKVADVGDTGESVSVPDFGPEA